MLANNLTNKYSLWFIFADFRPLTKIRLYFLASQTRIACSIKERRLGDIAKAWANTENSYVELGWTANYDLKIMVEDAWHWRQKNPEGYN